ncbi:MAG: hypothetical protein KAT49_00775 [Methanomicrobia archaeon]|nr:hypothetical protein [Methanomicrobia archaeon]
MGSVRECAACGFIYAPTIGKGKKAHRGYKRCPRCGSNDTFVIKKYFEGSNG